MASVGVGVDVLVTVHEKVTTGKARVAQSGRHWKRGQERLRKCADNETGGCRRSNTGVGQTCDGRYVFGPVVDFEFTKKSTVKNCNLKQQVPGNCQEDDYAL